MNKKATYDDQMLVRRYQNGEEEALKLLIKRFHPTLLRVIRHQARDAAPVEDIAQECWYAIIPRLDEVELKISFEAWAVTIARRKAIDWVRGQQRNREHNRQITHEETEKVHESEDSEELIRNVQLAIRQLPPTQRVVLELFYLENLSLKEISKVLDVAEGTVKSRLFHAREQLKNIINP